MLHGPKFLFADDNEKIRNGICSALEARSGWIVCGREVDGMDAVEKAVDLKPAVILVDVSMPGLNGLKLQDAFMIKYRTPKS